MKILILNQHFYPEIAATAQIVSDLAIDLKRHGNAVSVVTGVPSYLKCDARQKVPFFEQFHGVKIYRVFTTNFDRSKKVKRTINYISFYLFAFIRIFTITRHDVVIAMTTPPYISLLGVLLKMLRGGKLVCWELDLYPDIAIAFGLIKRNGILGRLLMKLSRNIHRKADMVVTIGEKMKEKIVEKGIDPEKVRVIPNWADPDDFRLGEGEKNEIRERLKLDGKFVIIYSGNMGIVHDFETVKSGLVAVKEEEDVAFLFIGEGPKKKELENLVESRNIRNVHFLPYQPREKMKYTMNAGDVTLITQDERAKGLMVPSKIYASLAVANPIIAIGPEESELQYITEKRACGIYVKNHDGNGLVSSIHRLKEDRVYYETCKKNAIEIFRSESQRSVCTGKFAEIIRGFGKEQ